MTEKVISRSVLFAEVFRPTTINLSTSFESVPMTDTVTGMSLAEAVALFDRDAAFPEAILVPSVVALAGMVVSTGINGPIGRPPGGNGEASAVVMPNARAAGVNFMSTTEKESDPKNNQKEDVKNPVEEINEHRY